jgi:hypothetical protein
VTSGDRIGRICEREQFAHFRVNQIDRPQGRIITVKSVMRPSSSHVNRSMPLMIVPST